MTTAGSDRPAWVKVCGHDRCVITGDHVHGRDWLGMTDPREFDTALQETQGALFAEPSRTGDIPLFGDAYGDGVV